MDLERIRAATPAALGQSFLLSAGASLMPDPVVEAMVEHLRLEQRMGGYGAADQQQARLDGRHIALFDDVMTTGSTLAELDRACRKAGAARIEVWTAAQAV